MLSYPLSVSADEPDIAAAQGRPPLACSHLDLLAEELSVQMAAAWQEGKRSLSEQFLARHPLLREHRDAFLRVICEELCLRRDAGEEVTAEELAGRFPEWRNEIAALLDCHRLIQQTPLEEEETPKSDGFVRVAELGRGVQGRVYLATQTALADRPVVLKVISWQRREHLSLARLQHTHIVPLYWVQDDLVNNLRTLCMPYFGTLTLEMALQALRGVTAARRTGRDLLDVLDRAAADAPLPLPALGPVRQFLGGASYVRTICWIGACLADALHYAHERGLVHLDVKPSNVLLAADGQPMLLDFHVAQEPIRPEGAPLQWLGGTQAYMSPEQCAAMRALVAGQVPPLAVDRRSDVYSLGFLMYVSLGGDEGDTRRRLESCHPTVSTGLADVIHKCMAVDAGKRYQNARDLAGDLRRHLADLPLRDVPNRSWRERWRKWRRRQPQALGVIILTLTVAAAAAVTAAHTWKQRQASLHQELLSAQIDLQEGKALLERHDYGRAVAILERGLAAAQQCHHANDLCAAFEERLVPARAELLQRKRQDTTAQLRQLMNRIRLHHAVTNLTPSALGQLQQASQDLWARRGEILALNKEHGRRDDIDQQVETDLLDLAVIWADIQVRLYPTPGPQRQQALRNALQTLADAEALFGPKLTLYRQRQTYAQALGLDDLARTAAHAVAAVPAHTAWDHYSSGRSLYQQEEYTLAAACFRQAVALDVQGFWPNFYQGLCAHRLRDFTEAVSAFRACISLAPHTAEPYYNRALAYTELGQLDRALHDYDEALRHDPNLAAAALNRGTLRCQRKEYGQALADLHYALDKGAEPAAVHYNLALVYHGQKDRAAVLAHLHLALKSNPRHQDALALLERLHGKNHN